MIKERDERERRREREINERWEKEWAESAAERAAWRFEQERWRLRALDKLRPEKRTNGPGNEWGGSTELSVSQGSKMHLQQIWTLRHNWEGWWPLHCLTEHHQWKGTGYHSKPALGRIVKFDRIPNTKYIWIFKIHQIPNTEYIWFLKIDQIRIPNSAIRT